MTARGGEVLAFRPQVLASDLDGGAGAIHDC
jgi:hypothetical protein